MCARIPVQRLVAQRTGLLHRTATAAQVLLGRDLERVAITVAAASLLRPGKTEQALQLLEQQLTSALAAADNRLAAAPVRAEQ